MFPNISYYKKTINLFQNNTKKDARAYSVPFTFFQCSNPNGDSTIQKQGIKFQIGQNSIESKQL
jgi:hypothetical protein